MTSAHADRTESTQEQLMLHGSATPDFWNPPMNGGACSQKPGAHSSLSSLPRAPGLLVLRVAA